MTSTYTDTYNRDDIRRVHASFAADYRIVAEYTGLRSQTLVASDIAAVKAVAEAEYLKEVHIQLRTARNTIRTAAAYRVSTSAGAWSTDRPGDLYWKHESGDSLMLVLFYNSAWSLLSPSEQQAFRNVHLQGWGPSDWNGSYGAMSNTTDRKFASRAYGLERTRYST